MNFKYFFLRLIRHFIPEGVARFLLQHRWIIRPGLESRDPLAAVDQYIQALETHNRTVAGRRILIFGYGGRFAVGVELLRRGAAQVVLCDHYVLLDTERNLGLLPEYSSYLMKDGAEVRPNPDFISLVHGDIREAQVYKQIHAVDLVLSTSVYEHLDDVDGISKVLAELTAPDGAQLHFVDLRDHYFQYPFEMLKFSAGIWRSFLNPTSNLNRLRLSDYLNIFRKYFKQVDIHVLARDETEFQKAKPQIRPEFLTGDLQQDSSTLIRVFASSPLQKN